MVYTFPALLMAFEATIVQLVIVDLFESYFVIIISIFLYANNTFK